MATGASKVRKKQKQRAPDKYGAMVIDFLQKLYAGNYEDVWDYLSSANRSFLVGIICETAWLGPKHVYTQLAAKPPEGERYKSLIKAIIAAAAAHVKEEWGEDFLERSGITPTEFLEDGRALVRVIRYKDPHGIPTLEQSYNCLNIYLVPDASRRRWLVDFWGLWGF